MNPTNRAGRLPVRRKLRLGIAGFAALALAGLSIAAAVNAGAAVPPPPSGWTTVFSDDFTGAAGTGVNTGNWLYDLGHGYAGGAGNWGTGEVESMTNSTANVFQDGAGHLVIKPIRDAAGNWTSGRIETQRTDFAAPAGGKLRIEASLQQPNVSGAAALGYWPAFWATGRGRPPGRRDQLAEHRRAGHHGGHQRAQLRVRHPPLRRRPGRPLQRDHRPRQRPARLRRLPDRLPHLRDRVRPQRLARAAALVPRRQQLLHRQRQPGRRDHLEQRDAPRLLHHPQRGHGRRLPGRVRRRPHRLHRLRGTDERRLRRRLHRRRRYHDVADALADPDGYAVPAAATPTAPSRPSRYNAQSGTQTEATTDTGGGSGRRLDRQRRLAAVQQRQLRYDGGAPVLRRGSPPGRPAG